MGTEASKKIEEFSWLDLPTEIVELIVWKLPFSDRPYFACVCKWWSNIMRTLLPIYPIGKSPFLLHCKTTGSGTLHFYSPSLNKTFQAEDLPFDFTGYEFLSAKDGFLLIYNRIEMMMVDPFSGYSFPLPGVSTDDKLHFNSVAIGDRYGNYVIFLISSSYDSDVLINVYEAFFGWELDLYYENNKPFCLAPSSNPVYDSDDDRFYCLGVEGNLGVFDMCRWTWTIMDAEFKNYDRDCMNDTYLVESSEKQLIAVQIENYGSGIHIFSLDREKMVWEEIYNLGDRCLFVGSRMSLMSMDKKQLRNKVFVPRFHEEPESIEAEVHSSDDRLYFMSKFQMYSSNKQYDNNNTRICSYNLTNGEKSEYFGSAEKLFSIWFEPRHYG